MPNFDPDIARLNRSEMIEKKHAFPFLQSE